MIDKTVVRGEMKNATYAAFCLRVDPEKLFSDYGREYIRESAKLLLAKSMVSGEQPEKMDERIKEVIAGTMSKAAYHIAYKELAAITKGGVDSIRKTIKEVIVGQSEENADEGGTPNE